MEDYRTIRCLIWSRYTNRGFNPFNDVAAGKYYYSPVLWAVQSGITTGTASDTFSPNMNCTRAQIVTLLYRWFAKG